ncbi:hypothetical protein [Streptomyces sp. NPDC056144]|uniref:hypothetical protein n=1 Tax=unclassified Streptomyces TaxID=2593676 RepID=UPI0035DDF2CD
MFVDFRVDLSVRGLAFLASLVLGVVLVFQPAGVAAPEEAWLLLGTLAALGAGARTGAGASTRTGVRTGAGAVAR